MRAVHFALGALSEKEPAVPNEASPPVGTSTNEPVDLIAWCAECQFEGSENLSPDKLGKKLRETLGHAVVMGTVHARFAVDKEQRLSREIITALTRSPDNSHFETLFDHIWLALHLPEPEDYSHGSEEAEKYSKTRNFLREGLRDAKVWERYAPYVREVLETNWQSIISAGSDADREWCIKVHVKFLSPVEEAQMLGALRVTTSELHGQHHDPHRAFEELVRGKAPHEMRENFAKIFVTKLGFQRDPEDGDTTRLCEAIEYFTRAFEHHAFWEGHRNEAVLNIIPAEEEPSPDELILGAAHALTISHYAPPPRKPTPRAVPPSAPKPKDKSEHKSRDPDRKPEPIGAGSDLHVSNWLGLGLLMIGLVMLRVALGIKELGWSDLDHDKLQIGGVMAGCSLIFVGVLMKRVTFWIGILIFIGALGFALSPRLDLVIQELMKK